MLNEVVERAHAREQVDEPNHSISRKPANKLQKASPKATINVSRTLNFSKQASSPSRFPKGAAKAQATLLHRPSTEHSLRPKPTMAKPAQGAVSTKPAGTSAITSPKRKASQLTGRPSKKAKGM